MTNQFELTKEFLYLEILNQNFIYDSRILLTKKNYKTHYTPTLEFEFEFV